MSGVMHNHDGSLAYSAPDRVVSPIAPSPVSTPAPTLSIYGNQYQQQQQQQPYQQPPQQEGMSNRIAAARRMAELQLADGHWEWSGELAALVQQWSFQQLSADPSQVTSVTNACLTNMCQFIWTARREGREAAVLSPAELASLAQYHGDMSWAKAAMDRAAGWLAKYS